ncbi:hypothetical protein EX895_003059 [Sporisorium graminicola]|uniref:Uncharacterized protein n=1 Tax=Sporisorium graminicola TaxID=280036 RepID=A0A4U7KTY6_9BASI|nr:hypothetical protein EX895_003059 [Sporisorium graminicola]TKY87963.1 hypothetical protein EX895_003059 [Sporisorium graminicola]
MSRPYILLALALSWMFSFHVLAANLGRGHQPGASSSSIHHTAVEQGNAETAAGIVESIYKLPQGHLKPVRGYEPGQYDAWRDHVNSPDSRFVVLETHRPNDPLVLSPFFRWQRSLLFLQVLSTGEVVPMGHAVVPEGIPPGHMKDFLETIQEAATTSQHEFVNKFGVERLVAPRF